MKPASPAWSERRGERANLVACVLYGVIAIMTAELAVEPDEVSFDEAALGALIDLVLYLSIAAVFLLGFGSSYVLDSKAGPALLRGIFWTLVLFAAKKLA